MHCLVLPIFINNFCLQVHSPTTPLQIDMALEGKYFQEVYSPTKAFNNSVGVDYYLTKGY